MAACTKIAAPGIVAAALLVAVPMAPARAVVPLRAVVSLSVGTSSLGQAVVATAVRSTVPVGDRLKSIRLNWGDGTAPVVLARLATRVGHRYLRDAVYTVRLTLVDIHNRVAVGAAAEHVVTAPGSYTGTFPFTGLHFYVSNGRTVVQDVSTPQTVNCSNGSPLSDTRIVPAAPITPGGTFTATTTSTGVLNGQRARYAYAFTGRFRWSTATRAVESAGTMRETVSFPDSGVTCTSNTEAWSARRDIQPAQASTPPHVGGYTGRFPFTGLTFSVASNTSIQNITDAQSLQCSDGGALGDRLIVPTATIAGDGSFLDNATDTGTLSGHPAQFSYTFRGNFHSVGPAGTDRAAGTMRESVVLTDTGVTCTSNTESWTALRTS